MKAITHLMLAIIIGSLVTNLCRGTLESEFGQPPESTKPRCYWYWMDGQITKEGITRDLEAMKRVGIGEGCIGIITGQSGIPARSEPKALTDEWWSFIEHAIREGGRLGVDIGFFNTPGWSQSGGPWVKSTQTMRYVISSETRLRGGQHFDGKLPVPPGEYQGEFQKAFQDIAVLAFPTPSGEDELAKITARTPKTVRFEMGPPYMVRSLTVQPVKPVNVTAELQASDDGQTYRTVRQFTIERREPGMGHGPVAFAPVVATFPATTARFWQLKFSEECELGEIRLSPAARVERFAEKSLLKMFQAPLPPFDYYLWPRSAEPESADPMIQPETVRDISKLMAEDGTLSWDVPAGEWIVLRTGMQPTGARNSPAPPEATGFDVDKMSRPALRSHFDAYVGNLLQRMPAAERKAWKHVVADSYEQGSQNWTDGFAADFQKCYGYDPLRFLPVMTGRMVGNADQSDRFLWDMRRLVADRIARDYVGGLRDLCHEHGLKLWLENYGHFGFPGEFLLYGGNTDEISGEFWDNNDLGRLELRAASSAAHIYGKPVVWAEAFTGGPAFVNAPRDFKQLGDWSFCQGINQFMLHVFIHQPWEDKLPGINAWFGTEFNRHNTWFEQSKAWIDYLRRCTVMLQTGKPVADVAYFIGEDAPKMTGLRQPELPTGRDFDWINADVIKHRLAVKEGRLELPDGMSYRVLVLPPQETMRPALLKQIRNLVKAGATIVGLPPSRSPSLESFPACDDEVRTLAREVWGDADKKQPGEHRFGKGRVIWGKSLDEILSALGSKPDFESPAKLRFTHRHTDAAEIYFVANPKAEAVLTSAAFRASGKAPELWWPDSGRMERPAVYDLADGVVRLPLQLGPSGSVFVVFRENAAPPSERIVSVKRNGKEILSTVPQPAADFDNPDNFTFATWVKPEADTTLVPEANSGVGSGEARNDVIFPPFGDTYGGAGHAGSGLAVGRNGVCVFELGSGYFAATLVHPASLTNWTHVAVVYRAGQPSLYLNGTLARTGLKSTHIVHAGVGNNARAKYRGQFGGIEEFSRPLSADEIAELRTAMPRPDHDPIELPPQLTRTAAGQIVAQVWQAGDYELKFADGQTRPLKVASVAAPVEITGPWEVSFAPGWGAPEKTTFDQLADWTKRPEDGVKYFSGKATYRKTFEVPAQRQPGSAMILDLGQVNDIAVVRVNGRELATLWMPPYRLDITASVKPGPNTLEADVVNTWNNRLAGDAALPVEQRLTSITAPTVTKDSPLLPAGLLGPVTLQTIKTMDLK